MRLERWHFCAAQCGEDAPHAAPDRLQGDVALPDWERRTGAQATLVTFCFAIMWSVDAIGAHIVADFDGEAAAPEEEAAHVVDSEKAGSVDAFPPGRRCNTLLKHHERLHQFRNVQVQTGHEEPHQAIHLRGTLAFSTEQCATRVVRNAPQQEVERRFV